MLIADAEQSNGFMDFMEAETLPVNEDHGMATKWTL